LWQLKKITYLYFIRTVIHFLYGMFTENFGLINVHLFDILPAISSEKSQENVGDFFFLESGNQMFRDMHLLKFSVTFTSLCTSVASDR